MARFSKKVGGREIGDAAVYAKPHTMRGEPIAVPATGGYPQTGEKTTGIVTRGNGAATRGRTARGPMA